MGSLTLIEDTAQSGGDLASFRNDHRVAYYDCADDGTNGLQDSEGTNHLTEYVASVATFGNTGVNGDCIGFTGNNDFFYLQSSNLCPNTSEDLTVSLWVKTSDALSTIREIVTLAANHFGSTDPRFRCIVQNSSSLKTALNTVNGLTHSGSGITINNNAWHHLLFMLQRATDGGSLCLGFLDGKLVATQSTQTVLDFSAGYFIVGRTTATYLNGLVDEIEVFKGAGAIPSPAVIAEMAAEYVP